MKSRYPVSVQSKDPTLASPNDVLVFYAAVIFGAEA